MRKKALTETLVWIMCWWRVSAEANAQAVKSNLKTARDSTGDSLLNVSANVPPWQLR